MSLTARVLLIGLQFLLAMVVVRGQAQDIDVTLMGSAILIEGTGDDDSVTVFNRSNGDVRVRANGQNFDFGDSGYGGLTVTDIMFNGGNGDDRFVNRTELTALAFGGTGRDRLTTTAGPAFFSGEGGDDLLVGGPMNDSLIGGLGDDDIFGNDGADQIVGDGGADVVYGGRGDDVIDSGLGDDTVYGQAGDDDINCSRGEDFVVGGAGDDVIDGGENDDLLIGSSGADTLIGDRGDDRLIGSSGDDVLCGGDGDDELFGASGADSLYGEAGVDMLAGGSGTDVEDQDGAGLCDNDGGAIGGVVNSSTQVAFPRAQTVDQNGNGIADPGDIFELDVVFTSGPSGATNVSFGTNFVVVGPGGQVGAVGAFVGDLGPNVVVRTDDLDDACVLIFDTANPGDEIFVEFDVEADGQAARFRSGPFIVGQITDNLIAPIVQIAN